MVAMRLLTQEAVLCAGAGAGRGMNEEGARNEEPWADGYRLKLSIRGESTAWAAGPRRYRFVSFIQLCEGTIQEM